MGRRPDGYRIVVNGHAGGVDDEALAPVRDDLGRSGAAVDVVATHWPDEVGDVVRDLPEGWALVACGGDGSLHVLVQHLWAQGRSTVPVGLLPMGTGNDLARALGLPIDDPPAAVERITSGARRSLDLLVDGDGSVCVNALHVGVGAEAAARAKGLKEHLADFAYPVAALLSGLGEPARDAHVAVDGERVADGEILMVGVCNGPSMGGGTHLAPGADPADGILDVVVVGAAAWSERIGFGLDLQRGRHLERPEVHRHRGREVAIRMAGARHDVDGEVQEPLATSRTWRLVHAAWQLLA